MPAPPDTLPAELLERHRLFNRNSEGLWQAFAEHRRRVNALLGQLLVENGRICVIGAGNCNDLELPGLVARVSELHLVDVDAEAVSKGVARQGVAEAAVRIHAPLDVTGLMPRLKAFAKGTVEPQIDKAAAAAERALGALPGPFELVVSACVLSQLMHTCRLALGAKHPSLPEVGHALVVAHLRALAAITAPGGHILFLSDTASSETYPLVELWDAQPPRVLLERLELADNVLSGTGSIYLRQVLNTDPVLRERLGGAKLHDPWLWQLGDDVTLLAYGLSATRAA